jgi:hypothetical protein
VDRHFRMARPAVPDGHLPDVTASCPRNSKKIARAVRPRRGNNQGST